jgi:hypothetical protein
MVQREPQHRLGHAPRARRIAHRIDQEHLITQAKIKKICLYLLIANAIFNLAVSALI